MHEVAEALTDAEIDESAKYFCAAEAARAACTWSRAITFRAPNPRRGSTKEVGGTEDLGDRLIEVAPTTSRGTSAATKMEYTVYAPPGQLMRGKRLATTGDGGKTQICATCHLAKLKGTDKIPPIAGRSPTYLLRQLLAFRNGARANEAAKQMEPWSRSSSSTTWSPWRPTWVRSTRRIVRTSAGARRRRRAPRPDCPCSARVPRSRLPPSS